MIQTDLFQEKTKPNNFITESDQKILDGPDYGIIEKHRKVPSIHRLIKFNLKIIKKSIEISI